MGKSRHMAKFAKNKRPLGAGVLAASAGLLTLSWLSLAAAATAQDGLCGPEVEFDIKVTSWNNANNRHELHAQLYKNGSAVIVEDA